jgi:hypothetical protein
MERGFPSLLPILIILVINNISKLRDGLLCQVIKCCCPCLLKSNGKGIHGFECNLCTTQPTVSFFSNAFLLSRNRFHFLLPPQSTNQNRFKLAPKTRIFGAQNLRQLRPMRSIRTNLNPYDECVANCHINGKQCTILGWYVDNTKCTMLILRE